jgi:colanic acid biosynthesis glycosyl transferase WcaI
MKILIVSQYFWPENFRINDLASELHLLGHDITVLTGYPNYPEGNIYPEFLEQAKSFRKYEGVDIIRIPIISRGRSNWKLTANYLSYIVSASFLGMWKLRNKNFDIIFVFEPSPITVGIPAILLKKIKGAPMIFWALDLWPENLQVLGVVKSKFIISLFSNLARFIYNKSDLILGQSKGFVNRINTYCQDDYKIKYFPSWAEDIYLNNTTNLAPEIEYRHDLFNIVFAGNIGEAQDFPAILDAAENLKDEKVRWIILGKGRLYKWVYDEIIKRGLESSVLLLGQFPIERMPSFYKHAQALLVSLKSDDLLSLTIPAKIQSYLLANIPIIGMLDGDGANVIKDAKAGIVSPAGDALSLANSIRSMLVMTTSQKDNMIMNGKKYAKKEFDRATLIKLLESWMVEYSQKNISKKIK